MNPIFADLPTTVFEVMSRLARETGAINLGQGFPDDPGPEDVRTKAGEAVVSGWNQYPPMMGLPELRQAVSAHYARFQGLSIDPDQEVMITSGATEAIAGALFALIETGDEVVLFQPMYDAYLPLVRRAGGVPRFVTLKPPYWRFSEEDLKAVFSNKTKVVLFNNPLNPSGTVFPREDIELLGQYAQKFGAIVVSDEVWEHVIFDGRVHTSVLAVENLKGRAVKIGSAGKIFALTGWKVGFVCALPAIMRVIAKAHQFLTFTTPPNLQTAVAYGLAKDEAHFAAMRAGLQRSRDLFSGGLAKAGFTVLASQATYFVNVDLASAGVADDVSFCESLVRRDGVAAIPVSAFYAQTPVTSVVRFCFAKRDETLTGALERLGRVFAKAA